MADVKWTNEQQDAIFDNGSNILVAAAAGSGKTAVLVERIINKVINENVDIDKILVVTFTNAAASEMRERILEAIYKKMEEFPDNKNLQRQTILINKASICTIDSFCLDIIRNNFFEIDASANFRVADTTEIELLKQEVIDDIFEDKYTKQDKDFLNLINIYTTYKDDEPLKGLILNIYKYIQSSPFPKEWLREKVEMFNLKDSLDLDFSNTIWGEILLKAFNEVLLDNIMNLRKIEKDLAKYDELEKYKLIISEDIINLEYIRESTNNWDVCFERAMNIKWKTWSQDKKITLEMKDIAKINRDAIKKSYSNAVSKFLLYKSKEANRNIFEMYDILKSIENVILEFSSEFSKRKKEKNIVDFNDIEHFALNILLKNEDGKIVETDIAKKYKEKFNEIAIDEYQDSNLVQEYILTSVSNGRNIFMVGDVKQSIYKFRQARPELFLEKYEKYKLKNELNKNEDEGKLNINNNNINDKDMKSNNMESKGQKIQLFKNFRSRQNILDVTNTIFENIMSKELGDITYDKSEFLNLGADYKEPTAALIDYAGKTEINIIDLKEQEINVFKDDEEDDIDLSNGAERIEDVVLEARFVANKIKSFLNSGYMVFDKYSKDYRAVTFKDIVILLRATSVSAPIYENELAKLNFPVFSDVSSEYLDSMEIQTMMALLKIIDNPMQDIPLIIVLRSSIVGLTDNDLVKIRLKNKNQSFYESLKEYEEDDTLKVKINVFLEQIKKWQFQEQYMALDELIWQIYIDTGFYNYVTLMQNGALRQANLKMLFERAKQYESASFKGLFNFISFIDKLHTSSGDLSSAKLISENENVIRIMSIHKSKGLEFPVVFLCGTGKQFNMQDLNQSILLHQDIGIGPKYINNERSIEYNTLAKEAIKIKSKVESLSEEMRVLYVALTRAKEKLFITGICKDVEKSFKQKQDLIDTYKSIGNDKINESVLKKYKTYLDWITLVYLNKRDIIDDYFILEIHNKIDLLKQFERAVVDKKDINVLKDIKNRSKNVTKEEVENFKDTILWEYNYLSSISIPTKTSVTKIKQKAMGDDENSNLKNIDNIVLADELLQEDVVMQDILLKHAYEEMAKPKFLNEEEQLTGAQRGTLMHMCFQKLDESKNYSFQDIKEFVSDLLNRNIITKIEADSINIQKLYKYTQSDLWQELKNAKKIYKEQPFYINYKAKEIYENNSDDNILVQGIIDLYYYNKNNELILVDYKTDKVVEGEEWLLVKKYEKQLEIYTNALEQGLAKKVDKKYIYSVSLNKLISL